MCSAKVVHMDIGSVPYDVGNDVMKSAILKILNDDILGTGHSDRLRVWFYSRVLGDGRLNGPTSGWTRSKRPSSAILEISNDDISKTGRPIDFVFDSNANCQQRSTTSATGLLIWTELSSCTVCLCLCVFAVQACEEFKSISRKLVDKPNTIEELAELREWSKTIPDKVAQQQVWTSVRTMRRLELLWRTKP